MGKPHGMAEWDGYPMPNVPKDRKPLSKEEEKKIGAELKANIRKRLEESPPKKTEPLYKRLLSERRKVG